MMIIREVSLSRSILIIYMESKNDGDVKLDELVKEDA